MRSSHSRDIFSTVTHLQILFKLSSSADSRSKKLSLTQNQDKPYLSKQLPGNLPAVLAVCFQGWASGLCFPTASYPVCPAMWPLQLPWGSWNAKNELWEHKGHLNIQRGHKKGMEAPLWRTVKLEKAGSTWVPILKKNGISGQHVGDKEKSHQQIVRYKLWHTQTPLASEVKALPFQPLSHNANSRLTLGLWPGVNPAVIRGGDIISCPLFPVGRS